MKRAVCNVSVAPMRAENSHQSEMVSQLLYGESVEILENLGSFLRIRMVYDQYEGWVDSKQIQMADSASAVDADTIVITENFVSADLPEGKMLLSAGSEVPQKFVEKIQKPLLTVSETALSFLNVPYLWSGRSFFGIDCSGFTQLVYKIHNLNLPRDAYQQAEIGTVLDFIEESEPGDLAFFDDQDGKITHVGMMLEDQKIIHAYGKVRIDTLDSLGIFNKDLNKHTHKLRFVKRIA